MSDGERVRGVCVRLAQVISWVEGRGKPLMCFDPLENAQTQQLQWRDVVVKVT